MIIFLFKGECGFNLFVNELNGDIVNIIKRVIMSEDLESTLGSILLDVPTRGLTGTSDGSGTGEIRNKPNADKLNGGKDSLKERRKAPGPSVLEVLSSGVGNPCGNNVADEPSGVVQGGETPAVLRMRQLGNEERSTTLSDLHTKANEETSGGEHAETLRCTLEGNGDQPDVRNITYGRHTRQWRR